MNPALKTRALLPPVSTSLFLFSPCFLPFSSYSHSLFCCRAAQPARPRDGVRGGLPNRHPTSGDTPRVEVQSPPPSPAMSSSSTARRCRHDMDGVRHHAPFIPQEDDPRAGWTIPCIAPIHIGAARTILILVDLVFPPNRSPINVQSEHPPQQPQALKAVGARQKHASLSLITVTQSIPSSLTVTTQPMHRPPREGNRRPHGTGLSTGHSIIRIPVRGTTTLHRASFAIISLELEP